MFDHFVLDMAWSPDGRCLLSCAYDGTVAFFEFEQDEFGQVVPAAEKNMMLERYGVKRQGLIIPESPLQLEYEQPKKAASKPLVSATPVSHKSNGVHAPAPPVPSSVDSPLTQAVPAVSGISTLSRNSSATPDLPPAVSSPQPLQKETRLKDGRKRITPMLVRELSTGAPTLAGSTAFGTADAVAGSATEGAMDLQTDIDSQMGVAPSPDENVPPPSSQSASDLVRLLKRKAIEAASPIMGSPTKPPPIKKAHNHGSRKERHGSMDEQDDMVCLCLICCLSCFNVISLLRICAARMPAFYLRPP